MAGLWFSKLESGSEVVVRLSFQSLGLGLEEARLDNKPGNWKGIWLAELVPLVCRDSVPEQVAEVNQVGTV